MSVTSFTAFVSVVMISIPSNRMCRGRAVRCCDFQNALDNSLIARAAAHIPRQSMADRLLIEFFARSEHFDSGDDHAWRAESTLQSMMTMQSILHRVGTSDPFDRDNFGTIDLDRQDGA